MCEWTHTVQSRAVQAVNRTVRRHFARFSLALKTGLPVSSRLCPPLAHVSLYSPGPFSQIPSSVRGLPMLRLLCKSFPNASGTPGPPPHRGTCLPWVLFQLGSLKSSSAVDAFRPRFLTVTTFPNTRGCYDRHPQTAWSLPLQSPALES